MNSYKELIVWQKSIELVTEVYVITKKLPADEKFGIVTQMNRTAVSIPSNIAEGWGRETSGSYLQFLRISRGSLMELETLILIIKNLNYITDDQYGLLNEKITETSKILQGLIKSMNQKIVNN
jgi:four helix bundle protein